MADTTCVLNGVIIKLFRNCPKPDGWFGCVFDTKNGYGSVKLSGYTRLNLYDGMGLTCQVTRRHSTVGVEYVATGVSLERSSVNEMLYLQHLDNGSFKLAHKIHNVATANNMDIIDLLMDEPDLIAHLFNSEEELNEFVNEALSPLIEDMVKEKFPKLKSNVIQNLVDYYDGRTLQVLTSDPYKPLFLSEKIPGYTWKQAEMIREALNLPLDLSNRVFSAVAMSVTELHEEYHAVCVDLQDPNVYLEIKQKAQKRLGVSLNISDKDIETAVSAPESPLVCEQRNGHVYVYTKYMRKCEASCVDHVTKLLSGSDFVTPFIDSTLDILDYIDEYETATNMHLDQGQVQAVIACLTNRLSILCGGPGCGKTSVIGCILYCWNRITGGRVSLSAPTWMAVKRTRDSVKKSHVVEYLPEVCVKTVASRIFHEQHGHGDGNIGYKYPTEDPIMAQLAVSEVGVLKRSFDFMLAIIDESSMVSLSQAAALLSMYEHCQIIWVGDSNQLPSISPGDFFGDLCRSSYVPCSILRINHRAKSREIVDNSRRILNGCRFCDVLQDANTICGLTVKPGVFSIYNLTGNHGRTSDVSADLIARRYIEYIKAGYTVYDVAVLSPIKKLQYFGGTMDLNRRIQNLYNPWVQIAQYHTDADGTKIYDTHGFQIPASKSQFPASSPAVEQRLAIRIGDKVVCVKNAPHDGRVNGDMGIVQAYCIPDENRRYTQRQLNHHENAPYVKIMMETGNLLRVPLENFEDFELGYAITVHKAQGSGYKVVLYSSMDEPMYWSMDFMNRNLFYTAVTRAEDIVEIFGSLNSVNFGIKAEAKPRFSLLPMYLQEALGTNLADDDNPYEIHIDDRYLM